MNDYYDDNNTTFEEKLELSRAFEPVWQKFYIKRFPNYRELIKTDDDKKSKEQDDGIDRIVIESNGIRTFVEEKVLKKVYPHFCFEWLSNSVTGAKGWIEKPLLCNYIAYAFAPTQEILFYEFRVLQQVWQKYKDIWTGSTGCVQIEKKTTGKNGYTYLTKSICVPIYIVEQCYREMLIKPCIESTCIRLISDKEYYKIISNIEKEKNETPEEKRKKVSEHIKLLKNKENGNT